MADPNVPLRIIPLGGVGEIGKNMLRVRVRRRHRRHRLRPDVPRRGDVRHRPRRARRHLPQGEPRQGQGVPDHPRPRGPRRRPAVRAARVPGRARSTRARWRAACWATRSRSTSSTTTRCSRSSPATSSQIGPFTAVPFRIGHSIPDAMGIALRTPVGTVVHTGDFKFDHTPVDGKLSDFHILARLGEEGVICLLSDSTRAENPGYTPSERTVGEAFREIMEPLDGRVIVATFASNIARIQQVLDAAAEMDRKVAVIGRSMEQNFKIATDLGYLKYAPSSIVAKDKIKDTADGKLVIATTGAQGEPMAGLARMANRDHRFVEIQPGDTVIVSASPIPGNEEYVARTIDNLFKAGANVYYHTIKRAHVSGHASQEELKLMLGLTKPRYFIPMHGEFRMLVQHGRLAIETGVLPENVFIIENGTPIEIFADGSARRGQPVAAGYVYVDGLSVGEVGDVVLRDRRALANDGMFMIVVQIDKQTEQAGRPARDHHPRLHPRERGGAADRRGDPPDPRGRRGAGRPDLRDRAAQGPDQGRRLALPVRADQAPADGLPRGGRGLARGDPRRRAARAHPRRARRLAGQRARPAGCRCPSCRWGCRRPSSGRWSGSSCSGLGAVTLIALAAAGAGERSPTGGATSSVPYFGHRALAAAVRAAAVRLVRRVGARAGSPARRGAGRCSGSRWPTPGFLGLMQLVNVLSDTTRRPDRAVPDRDPRAAADHARRVRDPARACSSPGLLIAFDRPLRALLSPATGPRQGRRLHAPRTGRRRMRAAAGTARWRSARVPARPGAAGATRARRGDRRGVGPARQGRQGRGRRVAGPDRASGATARRPSIPTASTRPRPRRRRSRRCARPTARRRAAGRGDPTTARARPWTGPTTSRDASDSPAAARRRSSGPCRRTSLLDPASRRTAAAGANQDAVHARNEGHRREAGELRHRGADHRPQRRPGRDPVRGHAGAAHQGQPDRGACPTTSRWPWPPARIRIEAPIPGKSAVGIEIPNKEFNVVALRRILEEVDFDGLGARGSTFALGRDVAGRARRSTSPRCPTC